LIALSFLLFILNNLTALSNEQLVKILGFITNKQNYSPNSAFVIWQYFYDILL
jgi:hypothetical protein